MMYVSYLSLLPYDDVLNSLTIQSSALGTYRLMCVFVWVGVCVCVGKGGVAEGSAKSNIDIV